MLYLNVDVAFVAVLEVPASSSVNPRLCPIHKCNGQVWIHFLHPLNHWLLGPAYVPCHALETNFTTENLHTQN